MALTKEQIDLLRKSSKTLAIIGLFRNDDNKVRYVFNKKGDKDGVVSAADFFAQVQPELHFSREGTLEIGNKIFNKYNLKTPLEVREANAQTPSQPLLLDSPLLDRGENLGQDAPAKIIQKKGKKVIKELIDNLDFVAYFTHSNFPKSLLKIAKEYLFAELENQNLKAGISVDDWTNTLNSDHFLCAEIVRYLTAYNQDQPQIINAVKLSLQNQKNENGSNRYTPEQVKALSEALKECKGTMIGEPLQDQTWQEISILNGLKNWLSDYPSDPTYGVNHPQVGNQSFLAHYKAFIEASNNIHRLVRTQALHSSIFCWLASKYEDWDGSVASFNNVAQQMYKHGVEAQGDKRIRSENQEERNRNLELIKQTGVDPEKFNQQLLGDTNYEKFAEIAQDHIFAALSPNRSVTRKALLQRATDLFQTITQLAGGKVCELLKENEEFNQLFFKYYQTILNTEVDGNDQLTLRHFKDRLQETADKDQQKDFKGFYPQQIIDNIFNDLTDDGDSDELKRKVKEAFIKVFAHESKTRFAEAYLENKSQIDYDLRQAKDLYKIRAMSEINSDGQKAGSTALCVTELAMPDFENNSDQETRRKKQSQEIENRINESIPSSVTGTKSKELEYLQAGTTITITDCQDQGQIGELEITEDNTIVIKPNDNPNSRERMENGEISFTDENNQERNIKIKELDVPLDELLGDNEQRTVIDTAQNIENDGVYNQLSEFQDRILDNYRNQNEKKPELNKGLRALLLSEYILAAPEGSTQLNVPDLSQILGLMVDIVEHLGEINDNKILEHKLTEDETYKNLLQKINLSKYYPVERAGELSEFLQYQLTLCQQLNDVQDYLIEVAELRDFFEAIRDTDLKIVVLNETLQQEANFNLFNKFSPIADSPSIIYLTAQAQATGANLITMENRIAQCIKFTNNTVATLQIPIFISKNQIPSNSLPVISKGEIQLPQFLLPSQEDTQSQENTVTVNKLIQSDPYLLLGTAIMLDKTPEVFGKLYEPNITQTISIQEKFGKSIENEQSVVEFLQQIWFSKNHRLLDTLIFTKWLNATLLEWRTTKKTLANFTGTFGNSLGSLLNSDDLRNAMFPTINKLSEFSFLIIDNMGNLKPLGQFGGANIALTSDFGTKLDNNEEYKFEIPWKDQLVSKIVINNNNQNNN